MYLFKYLPLAWSERLSDTQKELFRKRCECIRDNRFWFAKPETLNDPYDCKPLFRFNNDLRAIAAILEDMNPEETALVLKKFPNCKTKDDIYRLLERMVNSVNTPSSTRKFSIWVLQAMLSKLVLVKIANTGVLCLTTDPKNILMWAHYANNHKGICLEVDIPKDARSLKKVRYTKEQPDLAIHEAMNERHGKLLELFYTKSIHWRNEKEWRMVAIEGNVAKEIPGAVIKRIIYGINTSNETISRITESIGRSIPAYQLKMQRNYLLDYGT